MSADSHLIRINKALAQKGICSRRQADAFIKKGWITCNGEPVTELGMKVDINHDDLQCSPEAQAFLKSRTILKYNKPVGIVTVNPQPGETCIQDILPETYKDLFPIGRLDKDSEGLILLTNDTAFARYCMHEQADHKRVYEIKVSKPLEDHDIETLEEGIYLLGQKTKPCEIERLQPLVYQITLYEGKNRQIRRMIHHIGNMVMSLKRIQYHDYVLGELGIGKFSVVLNKLLK